MTTRGKILLTVILLAVVGFGVYRWWDKIAPQSRPQNQSIDVAKVKQEIEDRKKTPTDIPLLIGTNAATLVERSGIPAVTGTSDYSKGAKDGKLIVQFPINVWPGWPLSFWPMPAWSQMTRVSSQRNMDSTCG